MESLQYTIQGKSRDGGREGCIGYDIDVGRVSGAAVAALLPGRCLAVWPPEGTGLEASAQAPLRAPSLEERAAFYHCLALLPAGAAPLGPGSRGHRRAG